MLIQDHVVNGCVSFSANRYGRVSIVPDARQIRIRPAYYQWGRMLRISLTTGAPISKSIAPAEAPRNTIVSISKNIILFRKGGHCVGVDR